jgi:hypothetical protein
MDKRFNTFESPHIRAAITLPQRIHPNRADHTIPYFFTSFLPMNILTSNKAPINNELLAMAKISPALEDAINAVAALHRKHQDQLRGETGGGNCETSEALQAYSRSVRSVQSKIASDAFLRDPSSLWTTFLLGLFEVFAVIVIHSNLMLTYAVDA